MYKIVSIRNISVIKKIIAAIDKSKGKLKSKLKLWFFEVSMYYTYSVTGLCVMPCALIMAFQFEYNHPRGYP